MKKDFAYLLILMTTFLGFGQDQPASRPVVKSIIMVAQATPPLAPFIGEKYLSTNGIYYRWDGSAWIVDVVGGGGGTPNWNELINVPADIADGDDDTNTQLTQTQVGAFATAEGFIKTYSPTGNEAAFDGWDKDQTNDVDTSTAQDIGGAKTFTQLVNVTKEVGANAGLALYDDNGTTLRGLIGYDFYADEMSFGNTASNVDIRLPNSGGANINAIFTANGFATQAGDGSNVLLDDGTVTPLAGIGGGGTDDQTAAEVAFVPEGSISSTNVQDAIEEVRNEAGDDLGGHVASTNLNMNDNFINNAGAVNVIDSNNAVGTLQKQIGALVLQNNESYTNVAKGSLQINSTTGALTYIGDVNIQGTITADSGLGGSSGDLWSDPVDNNIIPDTDASRSLGSEANAFLRTYADRIVLNASDGEFWMSASNISGDMNIGKAASSSGTYTADYRFRAGGPVNSVDVATVEWVEDQGYGVGGGGGLTTQQAEELANIAAGAIKYVTISGDVTLTNENYNPSTTPDRGAKVWNLVDGNHTITVPSTSSFKTAVFIAPDVGTVTFESGGPEFKIAGETNVFGFELSNGASCAVTRFDDNTIRVHGVVTSTNFALADTTAPSVPTNLVNTAQTETGLTYTFTASTDNFGVTGYEYDVDDSGTPVDNGNSTTINLTGLTSDTSYDVKVRAYDAAANTSAYTANVSGTTDAGASTYGTNPNDGTGTELITGNAGSFQPGEADSDFSGSGFGISSSTSVADTSNGYGDYVAQLVANDGNNDRRIYGTTMQNGTTYRIFILYRMLQGTSGAVRVGDAEPASFENLSATDWTLISADVVSPGTNQSIEVKPANSGSAGDTMQFKISIKQL